MAMEEIKAKIEEAVAKLKADPKLMTQFKTEPVKALETIFGVDLPDDIINKVIDGIKARLAGEAAKNKAKDAANDVKEAFGDAKNIIGGFISGLKK